MRGGFLDWVMEEVLLILGDGGKLLGVWGEIINRFRSGIMYYIYKECTEGIYRYGWLTETDRSPSNSKKVPKEGWCG